MANISIKFPETDVVGCIFTLRTMPKNVTARTAWDHMDHRTNVPRDIKVYKYRVPKGLQGSLHYGDFVVVHCTNGYQVCEVVETNVLVDDSFELDYVVDKFTLGHYADELERAESLETLRKRLLAEKARIEKATTYETLANMHPEFKAIWEDFKAMGGSV